jgi:hypothetical protein
LSSSDPSVTGEVSVSTAVARAQAAAPTGLRPVASLMSLLASIALATTVLALAFGGTHTKFEDVALGLETTPVYAELAGYPINAKAVPTVAKAVEGWRARGARPVIAWLGNSQVHGVNQIKPGDRTAPLILHEALADEGVDLIAFTQPSANLQEHYVMFEYIRHQLPLKGLVLPVVFLNQRENAIRGEIAEAVSDPGVRSAIESSEIGKKILGKCEVGGKPGQAQNDQAALHETAQEKVEAWLNEEANAHSPVWAARPEARGRIDVAIDKGQKTLLGVRGQSKRRLLRAPYTNNMAALEQTLKTAEGAGIRAVVYIAPIRGDVEPPYFQDEYDAFKQEVIALCKSHGAGFANLEGIVPPQLWGTRSRDNLLSESEIDFFHFQGPAHEILARRLEDLIKTQILSAPAPTP